MLNLNTLPITTFPDGHVHLKLDIDIKNIDAVYARIRTWNDLFILAQLKEIYPEIKTLHILYLFGMRCDRKFSRAEANDFKIIGGFIARMGWKTITLFDAHSPDNFLEFSGVETLEDRALVPRLIDELMREVFNYQEEDISLLFPDAGAVDRYFPLSVKTGATMGKKTRLPDGSIEVSFTPDLADWKPRTAFVIADDLIDGGATFIKTSQLIKEAHPQAKVYLVVAHALFSKGWDILRPHIDQIYCTDSYQTIPAQETEGFIKQFKVEDLLCITTHCL